MHPPFYTVDHKVGPDIRTPNDHRPPVRRGLPEALRLTPATTGWPPVAVYAPNLRDADMIALPSGLPAIPRIELRIVPLPRNTWRDRIGRWLIRAGQRMILENRI